MKYNNPIVKGFYPDPSVCTDGKKYYMVTSSFQYFPGVPLFESVDLVNWTQIGHVLTRESQLPLAEAASSAGIFAPTIRFNDGRFYMVTTNTTTGRNFYVTTDNIYGEWSEPLYVEQDGIDPSLYFEDGHAYFMSNGADKNGKDGIFQCEIDIVTGKKLSESKLLWGGTGGRFLESPHLFKIGKYYYITAAEGGTEYGHMITCARSENLWGEYVNCPGNPVLTNRDLGGNTIQGIGHGDLVRKESTGEWFILSLGFRQIDRWMPFHHLGREVFLTPVTFGEDGWFRAGEDGTTAGSYEIQGDFVQKDDISGDFSMREQWVRLRNPDMSRYELSDEKFVLRGSRISLDEPGSPTFIGIRQRDFVGRLSCRISAKGGVSGVSVFMDEKHHYDLCVAEADGEFFGELYVRLGSVKSVQKLLHLKDGSAKLEISFDNFCYRFSINGESLGIMETRYVSSEVALGFTGVLFGLFSVGGIAEFTGFSTTYGSEC